MYGIKISLVLLIFLTMFITGCNCSVTSEEPTSQLPTLEPTAPESSAEYSLQLAERFCPVIHLNGDVEARENFEPDPVQLMVDLSLLKELGNPEFSEKPSIIDLQRWAQCVYYLDVANLDPKTNTLGEYKAVYEPVKASYHPTIYARVKEGTDHTVLQYWLFYYFNDWRNFHDDDWELIQLNFAGYTAKELMESERLPVFAAYS
jgi:hypothetical protein